MPTVKIVPFPGSEGPIGPRGLQGIQGDTGLTGPLGDATAYTPEVPADWNAVPTTIAQALDELAARLRIAE